MSKLTSQIGFWTSIVLLFLGIAYLVIVTRVPSFDALISMGSASPIALLAGIDTLLTAFSMVVLLACLTQFAPSERKVLGQVGFGFTLLFAAMVSINRFVQLTVIRQSSSLADAAGLERFMPYGSQSVFFALEMLGWGAFLSIAAFSIAPLFTHGRLERWISILFLAYGILGITSVIGYALNSPVIVLGYIAWGPVLLVAVTLLAFLFWRHTHTAVLAGRPNS